MGNIVLGITSFYIPIAVHITNISHRNYKFFTADTWWYIQIKNSIATSDQSGVYVEGVVAYVNSNYCVF